MKDAPEEYELGRPPSGDGKVRIVVLDSGLAPEDQCTLPSMVIRRPPEQWGPTKPDPDGVPEPLVVTDNTDHPDENGDRWLDPISGHGTFIAGLLSRLAPFATIQVGRVLETTGEGNDADLAYRIDQLASAPPSILCLSLSCYTEDDQPPLALSAAVARLQQLGTAVVCSAGNDASCRVTYPAALPDVVAVGALGSNGPAPFTNWGAWVRACAPGCDIVSTFFKGIDEVRDDDAETADFYGWARWSGSSFASPIVAAAIAREMHLYSIDARDAVERVVDDERLFRFPGLGTVVNLH